VHQAEEGLERTDHFVDVVAAVDRRVFLVVSVAVRDLRLVVDDVLADQRVQVFERPTGLHELR